MPPWVSFQGGETGEWKRGFCVFNRTQRRRKDLLFVFFFGLVRKIFFACPIGLLHNEDYASSYSRNVSIPAAHQNPDVPCQGMYVLDPKRLQLLRFISSLYWQSLDWPKVPSFLSECGLVENMWDWSYPLGQWHLSLKVQWQWKPAIMLLYAVVMAPLGVLSVYFIVTCGVYCLL